MKCIIFFLSKAEKGEEGRGDKGGEERKERKGKKRKERRGENGKKGEGRGKEGKKTYVTALLAISAPWTEPQATREFSAFMLSVLMQPKTV